MRYVAILEENPESWGAYVPDLPGCVAAGETRQETLDLIREAIEFHLDGMKERGDPIPEPHSLTEVVQVDAASSSRRQKFLLRGDLELSRLESCRRRMPDTRPQEFYQRIPGACLTQVSSPGVASYWIVGTRINRFTEALRIMNSLSRKVPL